MTAARRPAPPLRPPAFSLGPRMRLVVPAVVTAVLQLGVTLVAARHQPEARSLGVFGVALLVAGPAALLARARWPVTTYAVVFTVTMAYWLLDYPGGPTFLALLVAFVNVALRGYRVVAWSGLALGYVVSAWVAPLVNDDVWPNWTLAAGLAAWLALLAVGTELARGWIERSAQRAQVLAEEARRRASEERLRIARELHDVLAHDISLINVRAGVALHLIDEQPAGADPGEVRPALVAIKDASRDALGELRSVLDVLRQGEAAPLAPTAGLDDLDGLVERARGTGLDVRVERDDTAEPGEPGSGASRAGGLPAGIDLAAFRIVQEALTNVVRHARATTATVRVRRRDGVLEVQVDDDGLGAATTDGAPGAGRGIAGMRERASALGGSLDAGPRPGRGYRVRARLPLPSTHMEGAP